MRNATTLCFSAAFVMIDGEWKSNEDAQGPALINKEEHNDGSVASTND